jgi:RNA polymerase sigma-70 factor (ECF subfamily)
MEQQNDGLLIARCQAGDKQAFGVLVEKYMQRAYYTALGLVGTHDDALDLSQEAFIRAYRSIAKFNSSVGEFFTWY